MHNLPIVNVQCAAKVGPLLYHKLLTPKYIQDHAAINHLVSASNAALHFKVGVANGRLLRIPIFQKGEVPTDNIAVYVKIYLRNPPTPDSDPLFAICDGTICNGIAVMDGGNYPHACNYQSFKSGPQFTDLQFSLTGNCGGIPITYTTYPNEVSLTFYPSEQLGSFHIVPHGGYTTVASFPRKLDLTQGLFLELYSTDVNEQYL